MAAGLLAATMAWPATLTANDRVASVASSVHAPMQAQARPTHQASGLLSAAPAQARPSFPLARPYPRSQPLSGTRGELVPTSTQPRNQSVEQRGSGGRVPATARAPRPPVLIHHDPVAPAPPPTPSATAVLQAFGKDFALGHFDAMWALLTPEARRDWNGPAGYAAYYRAKFAPVALRGLSLGVPRVDATGTHIPLTLDLVWKGAGGAGGQPQVLSYLRNLDATLVHLPDGWRVVEGGPLDPEAPVIPPPHPVPVAIHVPILMYHHISSQPPLAQSQVGLTVSDEDFAAQLAYLAAHGYHAVRLVDLFNNLYYRRPLPDRPVILSFDDGYLDNYTDAFPLLRRYHMAGEFAIIAAYPGITLGVNRYMTWPQITEMAAAGMDVESHTIDHQDLGLLDPAHATYEIQYSRGIIETHIHRAVQFMTYPSGEPFRSGTPDAQRRITDLLGQYGYVGALLDPVTPSMLQVAQSPYQLPRVRVSNDTTLDVFAAGLNATP